MTAVSYLRVSHPLQEDGIELQREATKKFCDREGVEITSTFIDYKSHSKPAFQKLKQEIESLHSLGHEDISIVVEDLSKLNLDAVSIVTFVELCKENKVKVLDKDGQALSFDTIEKVFKEKIGAILSNENENRNDSVSIKLDQSPLTC